MRQGNSKGKAILVLFLIAAIVIQGRQTPAGSGDLAVTAAEQYLTQAIPSVNRGENRGNSADIGEQSDSLNSSGTGDIDVNKGAEGEETERGTAQNMIFRTAMVLTEHSLPILAGSGQAENAVNDEIVTGQLSENGFGSNGPEHGETAGGGQPQESRDKNGERDDHTADQALEGANAQAGDQPGEAEEAGRENAEPQNGVQITDSVKAPDVLIYHTHATESYQPVSEGNFHSVEKSGTVRQVGDVMAKRLEELGYSVIHDETIHDNPSYNQSYSRSLETAKGYLNQYKNVALVVDLHRDAAGYVGNVGKTVSVEGRMACAYAYVIGQGNPNVGALTETVNDLNRAAGAKYPGFTGRIIEKAYKFNQYISDHHILLEVGNNENTIEQAELTGYYMAEVIAAYLKERGI